MFRVMSFFIDIEADKVYNFVDFISEANKLVCDHKQKK